MSRVTLQCELWTVSEMLAECGQLDRDLCRSAEAGLPKLGEQIQISHHHRVGMRRIGGVLPEMVNADQQPGTDQAAGHSHYLVGGLTCDEAFDHPGGQRRRGHQSLDLLAAGDSKQGTTQHSLPPFANAWSCTCTFCELPRL
jgi:hypothetical protein